MDSHELAVTCILAHHDYAFYHNAWSVCGNHEVLSEEAFNQLKQDLWL